jgi:hypothetical protein
LYAFELVVNKAKEKYDEINKPTYSLIPKPVRTLTTIKKPENVISPEDRIRIGKVIIKSPGFWEFIGNGGPLETIREYLCDRHERKKDITYRNRQEREAAELELEKRRLEILKGKIDILKDCGIPEEKIGKAVIHHIDKPLKELDMFQDRGFAEDAKLLPSDRDPEETERPKRHIEF